MPDKSKAVEYDWKMVVADGVHYEPSHDEWVVVVDGEEVAWASTQGQAWRSYREVTRVRADHARRNPANLDDAPIPVYSGGVLQMTIGG